jgi:hypothetical protein
MLPKDERYLPMGTLPTRMAYAFSIKMHIAAKYLYTHDKIQIEDIMNRYLIYLIRRAFGVKKIG